jgi:hypothetical protein
MKTATLNDYWTFLSNLPEELRAIVLNIWDETGRPKVMHPKNDAIIAILKKNSGEKSDGETFLSDMAKVFPEMKREEAAIYYNAFMTGANCVADKIVANYRQNKEL